MRSLFAGLLLFILNVTFAYGSEMAGNITDHQGVVKVFREGEVRGVEITDKGHDIFVKEIIKTKRDGLAFITFVDTSRVMMKENSIIDIEGIKDIGIGEGRVIFDIKRQESLKGVIVKTKSVVIGVKGTTFLVDYSGEKMQIYLKEGSLNVSSVEDSFIRYRKRGAEEFEEYKKKERKEFEEYREELEEQFREYVKEFEMKGGTAIAIDNNIVTDLEITPEIEEEFMLLERYSKGQPLAEQ